MINKDTHNYIQVLTNKSPYLLLWLLSFKIMMITGSRVDYVFTPPTILEQKEIIKQYYSPF